MDAKATFIFIDFNLEHHILQCKNNETMGQIFTKFSNKAQINLKDYEFYYKNKKIDFDSTIIELKDDKEANHITILVKKRSKINKCPKCVCNNCIIKIEDYKLKFSECRYGHEDSDTLDNYEKSQKIDYEQIKCDNSKCEKTQRDELIDFVKCLNCSKLVGKARYYCKECSETGRCKGCNITHKMIEYDLKYYYCPEHFKEFKFYCVSCNANCCESCLKEHDNHIINKFELMNPNIKSIKSRIEEIATKIEELQLIVDHMKNSLDRALNIMIKYKEIALDIIGKYESYNTNLKNYQVLKTISNLVESNRTVLDDLDDILANKRDENGLILQFAKLIGIYEGNRAIFKGKIIFKDSDSFENNKETETYKGKSKNGPSNNNDEKNTDDNTEKNKFKNKEKNKK